MQMLQIPCVHCVMLAIEAINQLPPSQKWYVVYVPEKFGTPVVDHKELKKNINSTMKLKVFSILSEKNHQ